MKQRHARSRPLRLASKKRISYLLRVLFGFFSIGYFVSAGAIISRLDAMEVTRFKVTGNFSVPTDVILASAIGVVQDNGFHLFNKANIIIYPSTEVETKILNDIKRIASAKVERLALDTVAIDIVERVPVGLWCEGKATDSSSSCYFFDHDGFVFDTAPSFSGNAYVRYWGGIDKTDSPIGLNFTDTETFREIQFYLNTLDDEGIDISDFEFLDEGDYTIRSIAGSEILISSRMDMRQSLDNLLVFLDGGGEATGKAFLDDFEYIDLRFGNKVFYRLRGD